MTSAGRSSEIGGCSMKHDLENIDAILEYCNGILATRDLYGDDIEDFRRACNTSGAQRSASCR